MAVPVTNSARGNRRQSGRGWSLVSGQCPLPLPLPIPVPGPHRLTASGRSTKSLRPKPPVEWARPLPTALAQPTGVNSIKLMSAKTVHSGRVTRNGYNPATTPTALCTGVVGRPTDTTSAVKRHARQFKIPLPARVRVRRVSSHSIFILDF